MYGSFGILDLHLQLQKLPDKNEGAITTLPTQYICVFGFTELQKSSHRQRKSITNIGKQTFCTEIIFGHQITKDLHCYY